MLRLILLTGIALVYGFQVPYFDKLTEKETQTLFLTPNFLCEGREYFQPAMVTVFDDNNPMSNVFVMNQTMYTHGTLQATYESFFKFHPYVVFHHKCDSDDLALDCYHQSTFKLPYDVDLPYSAPNAIARDFELTENREPSNC